MAGRKDADITVVEFFDYRCGYCKKVLPTLQSLMEADPNVRVVFKELPILGPDSLRGALAAQAVWNIAPEKYLPFHVALMQTRGGIDESLIVETARKVGVDPDKLAAAMDDPSVKAKIESNLTLAQKLQINGTPAFVIGDKLLPGAVDLATIKETIADARSR
ncbi:MAG: DsbA family protein [Rhodospirillales bacterium]|nr:DsbA family protein [Rhodospirillales bacterium]